MIDTTKIIHAPVGGGRYTVTAPIVKEDYGLYLLIEGLELPATYEVDFSNSEHNGTSVTMIGNSDGVLIPSQFISSGKDVFAFLYHVGVDFGRTVYKFRIPNKLRPDRTDETPTPEEQSLIDQAIAALNNAVEQTAQDVINADASAQSASDSADRAEIAEQDAENAADVAHEYADRAETSASQASASATASAQSAEASARCSSDAQDSAEEAQGYAQASDQSATASANSASQASGYATSASQSASSAQGYASSAQTSANTASTKASEASTSALTASTKASDASASAQSASGYATQAESAKNASQTAQGLAESARDDAVQAKSDAESARDEAQNIVDGISGKVEQIDDNTADIASLEEDIYKPYAVDSASGAIASFVDGADDIPLKSLVVDIDPVQDLHGYDSPWVAGGGKNKFFADGSIDAYLASDGAIVTNYQGWKLSDYIPVKADTTYTFNPNTTEGAAAKLGQYDSEKTFLGFLPSGKQTFTTPSNCTFMRFSYRDTSTDIQLEEGSTATDYAPYENICPISGWEGMTVNATGKNLFDADKIFGTLTNWTKTNGVYSGESKRARSAYNEGIDGFVFESGKRYTISFDYSQANESGTGFTFAFFYTDGTKNVLYCNTQNHYELTNAKDISYISLSYGSNMVVNLSNIQLEEGTSATEYEPYTGRTIPISWQTEAGTVYGGKLDVLSGVMTVYPYYASYNGETLTGEWISDRDVYAVGTTPTIGAQVVNIGAEGTEYQLTPQEVNSLLGANNILADTGDTEVEYRADTKLYIEKLTQPEEDDMIADSAISSGQFFMIGNSLYRALTSIASGATITVGTNAQRVSLSDALNLINA